MGGETIRDVVFRLRIELAEQQMKAPDVRPVTDAIERTKKASVEGAAARERAETKAAAESARHWERQARNVERSLSRTYEKARALREREAQAAEREAQQMARRAERAASAQERAYQRAGLAALRLGDNLITIGRGIALMSASGEKDTERLLRAFVKVSATVDVLRGAIGGYYALTQAIRAAAAARIALNAAEAVGAKGAIGVGALSRIGPLGSAVAAGTVATLGTISLFHKGTREGLGELLGLSDMAGDEREAGARMVESGRLYNQGRAPRRALSNQAFMQSIERRALNLEPLEAREMAASELRTKIGTAVNRDEELTYMRQLLAIEKDRVELIKERVQAQTASQQATAREVESQRRMLGGGALGFLGLSGGEQRMTVGAAEKLRRGERLSVRELQLLSVQSPYIGEEGRRGLDVQARERAAERGFDTVAQPAIRGVENLSAQLDAQQGALNQTVTKYGTNFRQIQEQIVGKLMDQISSALEEASKQRSEEERQALIAAAKSHPGSSPSEVFWRAVNQPLYHLNPEILHAEQLPPLHSRRGNGR